MQKGSRATVRREREKPLELPLQVSEASAVGKKLDFDASISKKQNVEWTPYFMIDGELISQRGISSEEFIEKLSQKIDEKLANLENN